MKIKIKFQHYRRPKDKDYLLNYSRKLGFPGLSSEPAEKGGMTVCTVSADGVVYRGVANCSEKDSFCYQRGREIAMGRALKAAENDDRAQ